MKVGDQVTWTTPMFGFLRFGRVTDVLGESALVRVDFGEGEIRNVPVEQLQIGWPA